MKKQDLNIQTSKKSKCIQKGKFSDSFRLFILFIQIVSFVFFGNQKLIAQAIPVKLSKTADGQWQLMRDGKPYYIKGAGGDGPKDLLVKAGANTFRTWGIGPDFGKLLDQAQKLGLTVVAGHWLGHPRHGFDYNDINKVKLNVSDYQSGIYIVYVTAKNEVKSSILIIN